MSYRVSDGLAAVGAWRWDHDGGGIPAAIMGTRCSIMIMMAVGFVAYIGLWNQRRWGVILLFIIGIPFCAYGFMVGKPILLNFLPVIAAITCFPLWPVLRKP